MNTKNIEQAIAYSQMIHGDSPYTITKNYCALVRLSKRLTAIDTHYCNGTKYTEEDEQIKAYSKVYKSLDAILTPLGIQYFHQSDPRGASLYICRVAHNKILNGSNYSSVGLAIY